MAILISLIVVMISQCICIAKLHVTYCKYIQFLSIIPQESWRKNNPLRKPARHIHPHTAKWGGVGIEDRYKEPHPWPVAQSPLWEHWLLFTSNKSGPRVSNRSNPGRGALRQVLGIPGVFTGMVGPVCELQGVGFLNSNTKPGLALARLSLLLCLQTLFV